MEWKIYRRCEKLFFPFPRTNIWFWKWIFFPSLRLNSFSNSFFRLLSRNKRSTATNFYVNEGEEKRNWIGKKIAKKRRKLNKYWLSFLKSILYFFFFHRSPYPYLIFLATHFIGAEIFFAFPFFFRMFEHQGLVI